MKKDLSQPSLSEIYDAFSAAVGDLENWASCGPEGFTKDERRRHKGYLEMLERIERHLR